MKGDDPPIFEGADQSPEQWYPLGSPLGVQPQSRTSRSSSVASSSSTETTKKIPAGQECSQLLLRRHSSHGCPKALPAIIPKSNHLPPPGPPPPVPVRTKQGPPSPIQRPPPRPTPHLPPSMPLPLPPPPRTKRTSSTNGVPSAVPARRPDTPVSPDPYGPWVRQDSSLSSDSYSQTSSPSYKSYRSMETPLLPNHSSKRKSTCAAAAAAMVAATTATATGPAAPNGPQLTRSIGPVGSEDSSNDSAIGSMALSRSSRETAVSSAGTIAFPRSLSTPTLPRDAVVRISGSGSTVSVHHKIKGLRKPSVGFRRRPRFHRLYVAQIIFNAVALVVIGFGISAYFKANPAVRYINSDIHNPRPGVCMPVIVSLCVKNKIPYNYTIIPSHMGHFSQPEAQMDIQFYDPLVDVHCYELAPLFLCTIFAPKCSETGTQVYPCRSLCTEMMRRCGFFLGVFNLQFYPIVDCSKLPESDDSNICIGHKEVLDYNRTSHLPPPCKEGFLCDDRRCIPKNWRCDGHVDCRDRTDELNCGCPKGTKHCGNNQCISKKQVCNGISDCPHGQDERECIKLSESMGDEGSGQLVVYYPKEEKWQPACVSSTWDKEESPKKICSYMGYSEANTSRLLHVDSSSDVGVMPPWRQNGTMKYLHEMSKEEMLDSLRQCSPEKHTLNVQLSCTKFECGRRRHQTPQARIVGGFPAKIGDWPFLAALLGGPEEIFYCAGVLISDRWLLTASHCVGNVTESDLSEWTIQLGLTRRNSHSFFGPNYKVKRVVQHPQYNQVHDNDVALFQLEKKVNFHDHLAPVCLPPKDYALKPGTECTVIGWGKRENNISQYEPAALEAVVPILPNHICNSWLRDQKLSITDGMLCAGYEVGGTDACQGDSGGPLLCQDSKNRETWYVVGIVSWGIKCAEPRLPGVYANVPYYVPWIEETISLYNSNDLQ